MQFHIERRYRPRYLSLRCLLTYLKSGLFENLLYIETSLAHCRHQGLRIEAMAFRAIERNGAGRRGESYKRPGNHVLRGQAFCHRLAACDAKLMVPRRIEYDDARGERRLRQFVDNLS